MRRTVFAYLMLACAALLLVIAFTGGANRYVDIAVAVLLGVVATITLVQVRRQKHH